MDVLLDIIWGEVMLNTEMILCGQGSFLEIRKRRFLSYKYLLRPCAYTACLSCYALCCKFPMRVVLRRQESRNFLCDHEPGQKGGSHRYRWLRAEFILELKENGDCVYLNSKTGRCSIYARRPQACRGWFCGMVF